MSIPWTSKSVSGFTARYLSSFAQVGNKVYVLQGVNDNWNNTGITCSADATIMEDR